MHQRSVSLTTREVGPSIKRVPFAVFLTWLLSPAVDLQEGSDSHLTTMSDYLIPLVFGMVTTAIIACPTIVNRQSGLSTGTSGVCTVNGYTRGDS
jgi:flagellar biosynthesis protein FliR